MKLQIKKLNMSKKELRSPLTHEDLSFWVKERIRSLKNYYSKHIFDIFDNEKQRIATVNNAIIEEINLLIKEYKEDFYILNPYEDTIYMKDEMAKYFLKESQ
jgi:hypothetical protein